jgi:hypothetical protein
MPVTLMKNVPISHQNYNRLKKLAEPLEDTVDSVIERVLDHYEGKGPSPAPPPNSQPPSLKSKVLDPFAPPSLTHTKVISACWCGCMLQSGNWNGLLDQALKEAKDRFGNFGAVKRVAMVNIVDGRKEDEGYHFLEPAGLSVQGQDANAAWRGTIHIAHALQCPVEVDFVWRHKEGAAHPGESGRLVFRA